MGFTRYWRRTRELDGTAFKAFSDACAKVCQVYADRLSNVSCGREEVSFEGNPGCEVFRVERVSFGRERDGSVSEFCKTQQLPYDKAVEECLKLLKEVFPGVEVPEPS
jgi:hypothetical protein